MLRLAGQEGKSTVFLFSDTQIVLETFVEDINNLLNNGEVPNLWLPDEKVCVCAAVWWLCCVYFDRMCVCVCRP